MVSGRHSLSQSKLVPALDHCLPACLSASLPACLSNLNVPTTPFERSQNIPTTFQAPERPQNVPRTECSQNVPRTPPERPWNKPRTSAEHPQNVPRTSPERPENVLRKSPERPKNVPERPQNVLRFSSERPQNFPRTSPELPKNVPGTSPEHLQNVSKVPRTFEESPSTTTGNAGQLVECFVYTVHLLFHPLSPPGGPHLGPQKWYPKPDDRFAPAVQVFFNIKIT